MSSGRHTSLLQPVRALRFLVGEVEDATATLRVVDPLPHTKQLDRVGALAVLPHAEGRDRDAERVRNLL